MDMKVSYDDPAKQLVFRRRSIRKYTNKAVSDDQLHFLLQAAMAAPSANNKKPWHFVVVRERNILQRMAQIHPYGKMLAQAGAAIVVCGDTKLSERYWVQDCSAATENILIAAPAVGLGTVWLGVHPRPERDTPLRELLGIPQQNPILSVISLGVPAEHKDARTQYDETRIRYDHW